LFLRKFAIPKRVVEAVGKTVTGVGSAEEGIEEKGKILGREVGERDQLGLIEF
jgi:hypothetical protein